MDNVKVYTVNGAPSGSASSLPDWLTRKRAAKGKSKRAIREQIEGTIDLIQHFEFPEASNRIKTTRDGHHAIATGTYKPQMRVFDLDELALKFERHSDAENVDFIILSDDWTKTIHLQTDRTIELHNQGGLHYRTRIPKFGRALAYHFSTCDALIAASGSEIYRLNLEQGRYLAPLVLSDEDGDIEGVNAIDVNPVHCLLSFGLDGKGIVEFWDPRSRSRVGSLRLPASHITPTGSLSSVLPGVDTKDSISSAVSVTSLVSRSDGLSLAVGTSTGYTLLYDIRSARPFAIKDQGYGLPVKCLSWIEGGNRMAGDGMVISSDKKVIKIWDRNSPQTNFASITPSTDINDVHHLPNSGLLMIANEGIQMTSYYIPQLGPAPKWCSFLDNITEEMEDQTVRSVYEDFKFVERSELSSLGLDHLVGTPALKPYMHGYFLSLKLYDAARVITNPFAYNEHREKVVRDKMEKLAESRIRSRKDTVKVNKALAEKLRRKEEREMKKSTKASDDIVDEERGKKGKGKATSSLLSDPRFKELFENPEFEVDEGSREFGMLNPSSHTASSSKKRKTAVEEEDEESDKTSSDGLGANDDDSDADKNSSGDSSDAGDLNTYDPRARTSTGERLPTLATKRKVRGPELVPVRPMATAAGLPRTQRGGKEVSFGERRQLGVRQKETTDGAGDGDDGDYTVAQTEGGMELSWLPSSGKGKSAETSEGMSSSEKRVGKKKDKKREVFGAGMEKGHVDERSEESEETRKGRLTRRRGIRSGSKNAFRNL